MKLSSAVLKHRIRNISQQLAVGSRKCLSTAPPTDQEEIVIPKRIPRGPTDILRALESTIGRDPTAAHYKYHDDPYLIPMSNLGKRTFAMAQESGRKAAQWVQQEHPELFEHREMDPVIEAFVPKIVYDENSQVTEDDLKKVIGDVAVYDAMLVYKILSDKGVEVSAESKQSLLELVCYYNHEDTLPDDLVEERWFRQARTRERQRKTWKDGVLAEEIFISMDNPTSEAYSAIIQGMAKFYQVDRAFQLFEEATGKDLILSTNTYNFLISIASYLKEGYDLRWTYTTDLLTHMAKNKLKPNAGTLTAILETLSTMNGTKISKQHALNVLKEFQQIGVEPTLSAYYYLMTIFCRDRGPRSGILHQIVDRLQDRNLSMVHSKDAFFFVTAMDVCNNHLQDSELAKRVDRLLHFGNNYDLIGDSYKESIYYRHFVSLLCLMEPLEVFMENVYNKLVPHIYVPEPRVMNEILKAVELNAAVEYMPKLWSDMKIFDHTDQENLITATLYILVSNQPPAGSKLIEQFASVGWDVWEKVKDQNEMKRNKISFTGEMLGNILTLLLWNSEFNKACDIMQLLDKEQHTILGVPKFEALSLFVDHCIQQKIPSRAISCIEYCSNAGYGEVENLALHLHKSLTLDEGHISSLNKIVGPDVLNKEAPAPQP